MQAVNELPFWSAMETWSVLPPVWGANWPTTTLFLTSCTYGSAMYSAVGRSMRRPSTWPAFSAATASATVWYAAGFAPITSVMYV